jgi:hypothetical protein
VEGLKVGGRNPFDARLVASLVAAGILAFAVFMVLTAYAGDFRSGRDGRPHALSVSAIGFQGIVRLIDLAGGRTRLLRAPRQLDTEDLVVLTLEPGMSNDELARLVRERQGRATLLVLPKWAVMPDTANKGWVRSAGFENAAMTAELLRWVKGAHVHQGRISRRAAEGRNLLRGIHVPLPPLVQAISGEDIEPLLATPGGRAILGRYGKGPLYILADPDLINNHGLKDPRRARAALAILDALNSTGAETISFDLTANGFGSRPNALKLAFEPPFVALTLAIFAAALLAGLHGAFRFGPAAEEGRAIALGKAALVENSAGLLRIVRREHRTGAAYAELIREEAARASGAHALRGGDLDTYLDRFSSPGRPRFSDLAGAAAAAANRDDLVSAARALFLWKKDLIQ